MKCSTLLGESSSSQVLEDSEFRCDGCKQKAAARGGFVRGLFTSAAGEEPPADAWCYSSFGVWVATSFAPFALVAHSATKNTTLRVCLSGLGVEICCASTFEFADLEGLFLIGKRHGRLSLRSSAHVPTGSWTFLLLHG